MNRKITKKEIEKIVKSTNNKVDDVISRYNKENQDELALKGGSRKARDSDEQKVLNNFNLK